MTSPQASSTPPRRFVTLADAHKEAFKGRTNYWICRPGLVDARNLQICQATLPPGEGHPFHTHPELEEVIYVLEGEIEQWVEKTPRRLGPGDSAHIPPGIVHATFNPTSRDATILAILSPGSSTGPFLVDVSDQEPWRSIRTATIPRTSP